jgi:hypothetical protein
MPNQPKTPTRSVRVGVLWDLAVTTAQRRGDTVTAVILRALQDYVDAPEPTEVAPRHR